MFATYLAVNVYSSLDSVMLGFMCGDFQVGIYTAAVKIRTVLTTLITSVGTVLLPRLSFYIAGENWNEFKRLLKKSYSTTLDSCTNDGIFYSCSKTIYCFSVRSGICRCSKTDENPNADNC